MNSTRTHSGSRLYLILSWVIASVLLVLAIRGIDWGRVIDMLRNARPGNLIVAFGLLSLSYFMRGLRWGILLSAERVISPVTLFWATSLGYLGNSLLPARAGELIRSLVLARKTAMSTGYVLATALTERILDALALVVIAFAALSTMRDVPENLTAALRTMAVVGLVGTLGVLAAPRLEGAMRRLLTQLPLPGRIQSKLLALATQFLLGARACQHTKRALGFVMMTVLVWSIDTLLAIQVGRALGLSLSMAESLLLLAALGLSSAIPSTPGYIGIYQFVAVLVLTRYDYSRHEALSFIFAFQAVSYLGALLYGLIGMWRFNAGQCLTLRPRARAE